MSENKPRIVWPGRDWIIAEYSLRSIRSIATEIGCSPMGLHSHMRRLGIPTRTRVVKRRKKRAEATE